MKRLTMAGCIAAVCFWNVSVLAAYPFTYQGRLYDDGTPAQGEYSLTFTLMNTPHVGSEGMVSEVLFFRHTQISDGYFTVLLDFAPHPPNTEADLFDGSDRWLYIFAGPSDSTDPNDYSELLPMPKINAAPYAHLAHQLQTPAALHSETTAPTLTVGNTGDGPALYFEAIGSVEYGYDADTNIANDLTVHVGNSQSITVDMDSTEVIAHDRTLNVYGEQTKTVGTTSNETIGATRTTLIGAQDNTTVVGSSTTTIGVHRTMDIGGNSTTTAGGTMQMAAGDSLLMNANDVVQLQNGVSVSNNADDVLTVAGAVTLQSMANVPAPVAGSGKVFVNPADGKLYYIDTAGAMHNLTAVTADPVSFSVKRDASYTRAGSASFETVDFSSDTTEWDNTGGGFNGKNSSFIAPADGLYTFHGVIFFTGLNKGDLIAAAVNADGKRYRGDAKTAAGTDETVRADVTVYLKADDVVTLENYVQSASSVTVYGVSGSTDAFTYFNGARVD